jgi:hypothetical protein
VDNSCGVLTPISLELDIILGTMMVEMQILLNQPGGFIISQTELFVSIPRKTVLDVQMPTGMLRDSHEISCAAIFLVWLCR